jgi:nitronate monooxygenase
VRARRVFLRSARRFDRMPDDIVVEGPLAGGHLGFGDDWREYRLETIVAEVLAFLRAEELDIPVIPAGGIFTGTDAVEYLQAGAGAVQVATRFTIATESGLSERAKQAYFRANETDVVVSSVSPTGYPLRMLAGSPCLDSNVRPQCEPFGYALQPGGGCQYLEAWAATPTDERGHKLPVHEKICLCHAFSTKGCYACGHYVYRLKDTTRRRADGSYQLLSTQHIFEDYQFSRGHEIALPQPELEPTPA